MKKKFMKNQETNIFIQSVSESFISINLNDEIHEVPYDFSELKAFMGKCGTQHFQIGEKIFNINEITEANFGNTYHIYESSKKQVDYPAGFTLLTSPKSESVSSTKIKYQDYLQSNNLPYISRDSYKNKNEGLDKFIAESTVVDKVLNSEIYDGCIIFGEGGIGKTRFMFEIGQLALTNGWIVLRVHPSVSSVVELKSILSLENNYLLLFDYIEESKSFNSDIVNQLNGDNDNFIIKILANCRYTYRSSSKFPSSDDFYHVELKDDASQKAYEAFVTNEILKEVKENLNVKNQEFFKMKASFAVFLRFLLFSQKVTTADIREVGSFKEWIKKRLCLTLGVTDFSQIDSQIFYLLAVMPTNNEQIERFYETPYLKTAIKKLKSDGWIEEIENDSLRVIHDTIVDEVLIIHLEINHSDVKREIKDLLKFAIKSEMTPNWLRTLERIIDQSVMPNKKYFYQLFTEGIQKQPKNYELIKSIIGLTPILEEGDRIDLFTNNAVFFKDYIEDINFGIPLSFTLNYASKGKMNEDKKEIINEVFMIWYRSNTDFLNTSYIAYRILSTYIKYLGIDDFVNNHFYEYLKFYCYKKETSYPLSAIIVAKGEVETFREYVINYLSKNAHEENASFVIIAWLKSGGDLKTIKKFILFYIKNNNYKTNSSLVLTKWLENGGKLNVIKKYIIEYLKKNAHDSNSKYIFKSWFENKGEFNILSEYIIEYLKYNSQDINSRFVFQLWFDNKGDLGAIKEYIIEFLKNNAQDINSRFVFQLWFTNNGDLEIIRKHVIEFLKNNSQEAISSFIFQYWFENKGDLESIKDCIIEYLNKNAQEANASFVFQYWFENNGGLATVQQFIFKFLENNVHDVNTSFVFRVWFKNNGDLTLIQPYILQYLEKNALYVNSKYVFITWFDYNGSIEIIQKYIIQFLEKYISDTNTNYIIRALFHEKGEKGALKNSVIEYLHKYIDNINGVLLAACITLKGSLASIKPFVLKYLEKNAADYNSYYVFQAWLNNKSSIFKDIQPYIIEYLIQNAQHVNSRFIFDRWLKCKGNFEDIQLFIIEYLEKNAQHINASFVFQIWLDNRGSLPQIQKFLIKYLENYVQEPNARFVLVDWLKNKGDLSTIQPFILQYAKTESNIQDKDFQFILNSWINAGADKYMIEPYLIKYLKYNSSDKNAQYPLCEWLKSGGSVYNLLTYFEIYFESNSILSSNSNIYYTWLKNNLDIHFIWKFIDNYLNVNSKHSLPYTFKKKKS